MGQGSVTEAQITDSCIITSGASFALERQTHPPVAELGAPRWVLIQWGGCAARVSVLMSLMLFFLWLLCVCNFVSVAHPPVWDLSHARGPCLASPEAIILSYGCSWGTVRGAGGCLLVSLWNCPRKACSAAGRVERRFSFGGKQGAVSHETGCPGLLASERTLGAFLLQTKHNNNNNNNKPNLNQPTKTPKTKPPGLRE